MKLKLWLRSWTLRQFLFTAIGIFVLVDSLQSREWLGALVGGYFTLMGFFGWGCAGNCYSVSTVESSTDIDLLEEVEFEEITK